MMAAPRFFIEGWLEDTKPSEGWKLKKDAPEWAKKEFKEFLEETKQEPDEEGRIILY